MGKGVKRSLLNETFAITAVIFFAFFSSQKSSWRVRARGEYDLSHAAPSFSLQVSYLLRALLAGYAQDPNNSGAFEVRARGVKIPRLPRALSGFAPSKRVELHTRRSDHTQANVFRDAASQS